MAIKITFFRVLEKTVMQLHLWNRTQEADSAVGISLEKIGAAQKQEKQGIIIMAGVLRPEEHDLEDTSSGVKATSSILLLCVLGRKGNFPFPLHNCRVRRSSSRTM